MGSARHPYLLPLRVVVTLALPRIGGGPGIVVRAGPRGIADALRILAGGGAIDFQGASGSMDWDANGDLRRGHIGIWRFTEDERIEEVDAVPFER